MPDVDAKLKELYDLGVLKPGAKFGETPTQSVPEQVIEVPAGKGKPREVTIDPVTIAAPLQKGAPIPKDKILGVSLPTTPDNTPLRPPTAAAPARSATAMGLQLPPGIGGGGAMPYVPHVPTISMPGVPAPQGGAADGGAPGAMAGGGGVPAPRMVGAHFDYSRVPYEPGTRAALGAAQGDEMKAVEAGARSKAYESTVAADMMGAEAERAERDMAGRQQREDERQAHVAQQTDKLQKATDLAASGTIDPDHWFHSRSTFANIASGVGIALGGFGAAHGHGNPALDIINQAVRNDIDAQKENLGVKQANVANQGNMLGHLRQVYGDQRMAELSLENQGREIAIQKIQAMAMGSQAPQVKANADALIAQLRQQQAQTQMQFERSAYVQAHLVGGVGVGTNVNQGRIVEMPDGRKVVMKSDEEAKTARGKVGAIQNIQGNIDRALELRKGASSFDLANPYSEVRKKLDSLQAQTATMVTVAAGQGAMSKGDQAVTDSAVGSMTGLLGGNDHVLSDFRDRLGTQLDTDVKAMGGEHVETGYGLDKTGQVAPRAGYVGERDRPKAAMPGGFKAGL